MITDIGIDTYINTDIAIDIHIHFSVSRTMDTTRSQRHKVYGAWSLIYLHARARPTDDVMLLIIKIFCLLCLL